MPGYPHRPFDPGPTKARLESMLAPLSAQSERRREAEKEFIIAKARLSQRQKRADLQRAPKAKLEQFLLKLQSGVKSFLIPF